jgi:hypothetical protein
MMFLPPGMPPPMPQQMPQMPQGMHMPFGISAQMPQQQQINPVNPVNPMAQALMGQQIPPIPGQGLTAPGGVIGMPNSNPPFGTPPWMRPSGQ